jgi:hypothetical protein
VELEEEQQELPKTIGLAHQEIQEGPVLVQNKQYCFVILLIEKLLEIMDHFLKDGKFHLLHD